MLTFGNNVFTYETISNEGEYIYYYIVNGDPHSFASFCITEGKLEFFKDYNASATSSHLFDVNRSNEA